MTKGHVAIASADAQTTIASQNATPETTSQDAASNTTQKSVSHEQLVDQVSKIWQRNTSMDLKSRYLMGAQIRDYLAKNAKGSKRQAYGAEVTKAVADKCKLSLGQISRIRSFAEKFESFEAFRKHHPEIQTWTQVKDLVLPERKTKCPTPRRVNAMTVATQLGKFSERFDRVSQPEPDTEDWKALYAAIQKLMTKANKALGTDFSDRTAATKS